MKKKDNWNCHLREISAGIKNFHDSQLPCTEHYGCVKEEKQASDSMYRESNRSVGGAKDGWTEQEFLWRTGSSTEERFAGTDWTDSPLRDDGRMPLPSLSVSRVQFKGFLSAASSACCPRPAAGCSYFSTCPHVFSVKTWAPGLTLTCTSMRVRNRAAAHVPAAPDVWPLSDVISENLETDFKDEDDVNGRRHTSETREKLWNCCYSFVNVGTGL